MKIGIVTQRLWGNYGGILQNYALQQVLIRLGHDPITLDLYRGYTGLTYILAECKNLVYYILGKSNVILLEYAPIRTNVAICDFIDKYIYTTQPIRNKYKSSLISKYKIEAVITGSDQVWRPRFNSRLQDMYLKFTQKYKIKRIAYAASFGTSEWEYNDQQAKKCAKLLKTFDGISVREYSGVELVHKLRSNAIVTLDPTLLLGRSGFDSVIDITQPKKSRVGAYVLWNNCTNFNQFIEAIAHSQDIQDWSIFQSDTDGMGPIEWIQTIRESQFFITDSFHGTVFCILYHVPFITYIKGEGGTDRFYSLAKLLGIGNRFISDFDTNTAIQIANTAIDWDTIDSKLNALRKESLDFLNTHLS